MVNFSQSPKSDFAYIPSASLMLPSSSAGKPSVYASHQTSSNDTNAPEKKPVACSAASWTYLSHAVASEEEISRVEWWLSYLVRFCVIGCLRYCDIAIFDALFVAIFGCSRKAHSLLSGNNLLV